MDLFAADAQPARSSLAEVERFERKLGGAPCNVAVGLARLGVPVALLGQIGRDAFGDFISAELAREGVDVSALARSPRRTALAFVGRDARGEPTFLFYRERSADAELEPRHVEAHGELIGSAAAVHLGTNTLAVQPCASATRRLVALCAERGVPISLDLNLRLHLWDDAARGVEAARSLAREAALLKANADEAALLTGVEGDALAAARALAQLGPKLVVVTRGADGAAYAHASGDGEAFAPAVEVVDTTGAGDAFCAALLAGLIADEVLADVGAASAAVIARRVAGACAAAAAACTALGATAGLLRSL
ncbi:MAG: carbohydrate kinase [Myxococcales bacterium]|nr:carbohydrate kinase [Myxococcales bacterium]